MLNISLWKVDRRNLINLLIINDEFYVLFQMKPSFTQQRHIYITGEKLSKCVLCFTFVFFCAYLFVFFNQCLCYNQDKNTLVLQQQNKKKCFAMFFFFFSLSVIKIATTPKQDTDGSVPLGVDWIWNRDVSTSCLNKAPMLSFHMIVNSFNCHTH